MPGYMHITHKYGEPLRTHVSSRLRVLSCVSDCALLIDPLPTCPFYEAGMPTSLTISHCRLALLPTETFLVDGTGSALTPAVMARFAMLYHLRHSDAGA